MLGSGVFKCLLRKLKLKELIRKNIHRNMCGELGRLRRNSTYNGNFQKKCRKKISGEI